MKQQIIILFIIYYITYLILIDNKLYDLYDPLLFHLFSFVQKKTLQFTVSMKSICFWLFMLGMSHWSLLLILPPPIFMPITEFPLAYFGEVVNTFIVLSLHIYVIFILIRLNKNGESGDIISIDVYNLLLLCVSIGISAYGCGYHNVTAVADLLVNFGETTKTVSYGGYFLHYFHEYVSHKIQYSGTFLFYILILNIIENKLSLTKDNNNNKKSDKSKYIKVIRQFLDIEWNVTYLAMATFHGLALGALFAALEMVPVIIIFCLYIIYRCYIYQSTPHFYMLIMCHLILIMLLTQLYIIKPLGLSSLSDEGRQFWWELKGISPQWIQWKASRSHSCYIY